MATSALTLPVDIPWKRLCVSEDMIDARVCDRQFPYRWRSSIAAFGYEPDAEAQTYEGMTVSYLKIVCTITGFQPDPEEVGVHDRRVFSSWSDPVVIEDYLDVVNKYYGCYGAILEVAIAPPNRDVPPGTTIGPGGNLPPVDPQRYPYFADFEPKKRELYETVSESGEVMSRSLEDINVKKGTTTTNTHEKLDIFGGGGIQGSVGGTGGGVSVSGQWGTRDLTSQEYTNVRTTDQAREMRETLSHTTQLTQMYHQFTGYHLGTNRAVFFMLPRPHIVQSDLTFVNGPRLLEGVQEVFLVVVRPRELESFCVEAWLETAHIASEPVYKSVQGTGVVTLHVQKNATDESGSLGDDSNATYAEGSETYVPPDGWEVDVDRNGGYHIDAVSGDRIEEAKVTEIALDHVTIFGKVSAWFEDRTWPSSNVSHNGSLDMSVTVYIRKKKPDVDHYEQNLWLTGRGICCCADEPTPTIPTTISRVAATKHGVRPECVTYESRLASQIVKPVGGSAEMSAADANHLRSNIGREMIRSMNSPLRYPFGAVRMVDTEFVSRSVAGLIRRADHPDNVPAVDLPDVPDSIRERIKDLAPRMSRGRLLQMSLIEVADRFGLDFADARTLRSAALGLAGKAPPRKGRWNSPTRPGPKRRGKR